MTLFALLAAVTIVFPPEGATAIASGAIDGIDWTGAAAAAQALPARTPA